MFWQQQIWRRYLGGLSCSRGRPRRCCLQWTDPRSPGLRTGSIPTQGIGSNWTGAFPGIKIHDIIHVTWYRFTYLRNEVYAFTLESVTVSQLPLYLDICLEEGEYVRSPVQHIERSDREDSHATDRGSPSWSEQRLLLELNIILNDGRTEA